MIKVMSFNIRYGLAHDGVNHWQYRKALALARINHFQPDLLGLQECLDGAAQADFVREQLTDYQFYGVHRSNTDVEMAPVLVHPAQFEVLERGCFWLSKTPDCVGSRDWDAAFPRTCIWSKVLQKTTGKQLMFLNTHFDYEPLAIIESARILKHWLIENAADQPLIITGDFNAKKNSIAYRELTSILSDVHPDSQTTFHEFGKFQAGWAIDWILASKHFVVVNSAIDTYHEQDVYPSDHYPLIAILDWQDVPS